MLCRAWRSVHERANNRISRYIPTSLARADALKRHKVLPWRRGEASCAVIRNSQITRCNLIIESKQTNPAPDGDHTMTIVDTPNLGMKVTKYGSRPCVQVIGLLDKIDSETGEPYRVSKVFTASVDSRSNFYSFVKTLTGKPPTRKFDTSSLIGLSCQITTERRTTERGTFANITNVKALPAGTVPRIAIPLRAEKANGSATDRAVAFP